MGVTLRGKKTCLLRFLVIGLTILLFTTIITTTIKPIKANDENNPILGSTHTIFVEIGTSQNCKLCHDWNQNIHNIYTSGDYKFEYVEMIVFDHDGKVLNEKAKEWDKTYNIGAYPTSIFDGDYQRIVGNHPELLPNALDICRNRSVADITADMTLLWLENATIKIDIIIENKEQQQYNGHIRACITEIVSRYDTYYGDPYHFGFLDYAFDKDITINANNFYIDNITWNGNEHYDEHGDNFGDIISENIQVTMGVINENNGFVDETVSARVGENSPPSEPDNPSPANGAKGVGLDDDLYWDCDDPDGDPINYDVYFGLTNPPPQVTWNQSGKGYDPDIMNKNTNYFWKIVAWDNKDASASSPIWSFATEDKDNKAPKVKIIEPERGVYIFNKKILPRFFRLAKIIGNITIEVNATDEDTGIEKVEFYINGNLKGTDNTEPYTYNWIRDRPSFFHIFIIKIIAYDKEDKTSADFMMVKKFL